MCIGKSKPPKAAPAPASAAPVTAAAPKFDQESFDNETTADTQSRKRKGKRALRIQKSSNSSIYSGTGLNIPKGE